MGGGRAADDAVAARCGAHRARAVRPSAFARRGRANPTRTWAVPRERSNRTQWVGLNSQLSQPAPQLVNPAVVWTRLQWVTVPGPVYSQ
eukprot:3512759-Prymnesium_polylepis.1